MDTTKIYFFHNIYGDADELLRTIPSHITPIPFGWDEETETRRNNLLSELNTSVSSLPSIIVYGTQIIYDLNNNPLTIGPHWYTINFDHNSKPWSWEQLGFTSENQQ